MPQHDLTELFASCGLNPRQRASLLSALDAADEDHHPSGEPDYDSLLAKVATSLLNMNEETRFGVLKQLAAGETGDLDHVHAAAPGRSLTKLRTPMQAAAESPACARKVAWCKAAARRLGFDLRDHEHVDQFELAQATRAKGNHTECWQLKAELASLGLIPR